MLAKEKQNTDLDCLKSFLVVDVFDDDHAADAHNVKHPPHSLALENTFSTCLNGKLGHQGGLRGMGRLKDHLGITGVLLFL